MLKVCPGRVWGTTEYFLRGLLVARNLLKLDLNGPCRDKRLVESTYLRRKSDVGSATLWAIQKRLLPVLASESVDLSLDNSTGRNRRVAKARPRALLEKLYILSLSSDELQKTLEVIKTLEEIDYLYQRTPEGIHKPCGVYFYG